MNEYLREEIISLETRMAFQEKMIEELNQIVYRQQVQIDFFREKFPEILGKLKNIETGENVGQARDEAPPPHY